MIKQEQESEQMLNYENEDSTERHTFWLVPYGNMMTILMIFFLVMYAFAHQNKLKIKQVTKDIEESITSTKLKEDIKRLGLVGEFRQFIWDNQLASFIEVSANARRIHISMQSQVLFGSGSVNFKSEGKKILDIVAKLIAAEVGEVRVDGHTDNTPVRKGDIRDNWELSGKRAYRVVQYLTKEHQLLPIRFSMTGYGEFSPIAPNDTPENRAMNRRIELEIIRKKKLWSENDN